MSFADPTLPENLPRLIAFLSEALGRPVDGVTAAPQLITAGAGMQNRNYACSARVDGETLECVLRCKPEQIMTWRLDWGFYDLDREFRVLQELAPLDLGALMGGRASDPAAWPEPFTIAPGQEPDLVPIGDGHFVRAHRIPVLAPMELTA